MRKIKNVEIFDTYQNFHFLNKKGVKMFLDFVFTFLYSDQNYLTSGQSLTGDGRKKRK